jgi:hypothetical protein
MRRRTAVAFGSVLLVGLASLALLSSQGDVPDGAIVFTQVAPGGADSAHAAWTSRIVMVDPGRPDQAPRVLTEGFHAARHPAVSHDGQRLLFVGKREPADPWQVWEGSLTGGRPQPVAADVRDPHYPAYLGDGRIVFSARGDDGADTMAALFTAELDGTRLTRITYHPGTETAPIVLRDGRVLYVSRVGSPDRTADRLMVVRYDGTASQLFYEHPAAGRILDRPRETGDARVAFVEAAPSGAANELVTVSQGRPLHSRVVVGDALDGSIASAYPVTDSGFLLAYRPVGGERFGLYEFRPETGELAALVDGADGDVEESVLVTSRPRPKVFVSVVDRVSATGTLFCLDARLTDGRVAQGSRRSTTLQVWGVSGLLGETALEADGSFHVELAANTPVRLATVDTQGRVVRGPSDWIWVRPNEKRGCIGCHEDREMAPSNRVPLATEKPAVRIPPGAEEGGS